MGACREIWDGMGDLKMGANFLLKIRTDTESDGNCQKNNTLVFFRPKGDPILPMEKAFWSQPNIGVSLRLRGTKLKKTPGHRDQEPVNFIRGFKQKKNISGYAPFPGFALLSGTGIPYLFPLLIFGGMAIFVERCPGSKVFAAAGGSEQQGIAFRRAI